MRRYIIINESLDYVETPLSYTEDLKKAMEFDTERDAQDMIDRNPHAEKEGEMVAHILREIY